MIVVVPTTEDSPELIIVPEEMEVIPLALEVESSNPDTDVDEVMGRPDDPPELVSTDEAMDVIDDADNVLRLSDAREVVVVAEAVEVTKSVDVEDVVRDSVEEFAIKEEENEGTQVDEDDGIKDDNDGDTSVDDVTVEMEGVMIVGGDTKVGDETPESIEERLPPLLPEGRVLELDVELAICVDMVPIEELDEAVL